jgi:hypothetical protein
MTTIRTRICNKLIPVTAATPGRVRRAGVEVSGNTVTARIIKAGIGLDECKARVRTAIVQAHIHDDPLAFFECAGYGTPRFVWFRGVNISGNDEFSGRHTYITLDYNHPADPCRWAITRITGQRRFTDGLQFYVIHQPAPNPGDIPGSGGDWHSLDFDDAGGILVQCQCVPGESLRLEWGLKYGQAYKGGVMAGAWFATPAFTGGEVISVDGEDEERTVTVRAQGVEIICMPTDFADYDVGDWVYLLKQGDSDAEETNRQSSYAGSDLPVSVRPAPVRFNQFGANGDYDKIDYNLLSGLNFKRGFEVSQHIGVITELWPGNVTPLRDAAKVRIAGLGKVEFDFVDIFYHCDDYDALDPLTGGMAAFGVDDEVVVLNEGGGSYPNESDLVIIGHKETLRRCGKTGLYIIIREESDVAVAWDIGTNRPAEIPGISYPATYNEIYNALKDAHDIYQLDSWTESLSGLDALNWVVDPGVSSVFSQTLFGAAITFNDFISRTYSNWSDLWEMYMTIEWTSSQYGQNFYNPPRYVRLPGQTNRYYQYLFESWEGSSNSLIQYIEGHPGGGTYANSGARNSTVKIAPLFGGDQAAISETAESRSDSGDLDGGAPGLLIPPPYCWSSYKGPNGLFWSFLEYAAYDPTPLRSSIGIKSYEGNVVVFSYYAGLNVDLDIRVQTDVPLIDEEDPEQGYAFDWNQLRGLSMTSIKSYFPNLGTRGIYVHLASPKE